MANERWPDDPRALRASMEAHFDKAGEGFDQPTAASFALTHAVIVVACELRELRIELNHSTPEVT